MRENKGGISRSDTLGPTLGPTRGVPLGRLGNGIGQSFSSALPDSNPTGGRPLEAQPSTRQPRPDGGAPAAYIGCCGTKPKVRSKRLA
jgi:hypothetical protein